MALKANKGGEKEGKVESGEKGSKETAIVRENYATA